jgi:hypothetical protein
MLDIILLFEMELNSSLLESFLGVGEAEITSEMSILWLSIALSAYCTMAVFCFFASARPAISAEDDLWPSKAEYTRFKLSPEF